MGLIPPKVHRIIDFLMVAVFAVAPFLIELNTRTHMGSFALAALILVLALLTRAPGETSRPVSMKMHKMLDIGLGAVMVAVPLIRQWTGDSRWFYLATGAAILVVALLTDDREVVAPATTTTEATV